jgi:hypothetical protein
MTTSEILSRCRHLNVKLARVGDQLEIDAPRDAVDADLLAGLAGHREEILAALTPDPLADPIFLKMTDWLWEIINTCDGETFTDEAGRRWDVLGTAAELYWWTPCSLAWLDEVEAFARALSRRG